MRIYNTLTRQLEELLPIEPGKFKMYSCGPTVYRYIHIGNLRTFTMADWLRRTLLYRGYEVLHIKNITDVGHMRIELLDRGEDKLIAQARKEGKTSTQIAAFYTQAFREDETALNILPAHIFPKATEHVPEMIEIVLGLLEKGIAYEVNGNVFYNTKKFPEYGKLSGNQLEGMLAGVRDITATDRINPEDFPLWKLAEPGREMAWDSPWGRGFPGWHIECSAMSIKYLGEHFDLHTGGVDNIFPHHEDEIAQSEGYTNTRFVNYWVHAQHLLADGLKMAKSTGNAYTRSEVEARGFDPLALRYFYTTAHYRSRINFTFTGLRAAQTALERLRNRAAGLQEKVASDNPPTDQAATTPWNEAFLAALDNDLNLPQAMAVVWKMLHSRDEELNPALRLALLLEWDRILGFGLEEYLHSGKAELQHNPKTSLNQLTREEVVTVQQHEILRIYREYQKADILREGLRGVGHDILNTPKGPLVRPYRPDRNLVTVSSSHEGPNNLNLPDQYEFSVLLLSQNSQSDLERCLQSILTHQSERNLEVVIIDNGSTDGTLTYLQQVARQGLLDQNGKPLPLRIIFADHNLGFAGGRNLTFKASLGRFVVLLDTSIELQGNIWTPLANALSEPSIGVVGPYGLVTNDLREFQEDNGPEVDAIEGYLLAFRRELLKEVGWVNEKFRFYRLMDLYLSFAIKAAGYRAIALPEVAAQIKKHPHREWYSLNEEEQRTKSKKNYDLFRERWHHAESLLVVNFKPENRWGHDAPRHLAGLHDHTPEELPLPGQTHSHKHQHWPDHDHEHPHYHSLERP
ncbi:MAG: cysteine--tRNA ligase [Chloroflexota bacterium]|nr:cysteine--tRNA ligase [Chloroflexota bacterium]